MSPETIEKDGTSVDEISRMVGVTCKRYEVARYAENFVDFLNKNYDRYYWVVQERGTDRYTIKSCPSRFPLLNLFDRQNEMILTYSQGQMTIDPKNNYTQRELERLVNESDKTKASTSAAASKRNNMRENYESRNEKLAEEREQKDARLKAFEQAHRIVRRKKK
jgi:hypothetical protein